jgi:hypothetical protein
MFPPTPLFGLNQVQALKLAIVYAVHPFSMDWMQQQQQQPLAKYL